MFLDEEGLNLSAFPNFIGHWTTIAASTASVFRYVSLGQFGYQTPLMLGGTSGAATASALGAAAAGAIPVITMVGVWFALGARLLRSPSNRTK
jgi:hypothetical protein